MNDIGKLLDGVAVANTVEPSPGDLERVLKQNNELRTQVESYRSKLSEIGSYDSSHMTQNEYAARNLVVMLQAMARKALEGK